MKRLPFILMLNATAIAGDLNIVPLGSPEAVSLEITCDGRIQNVDLPYGGTTGRFVLPEKVASIRLPNREIPAITIPATLDPYIAVLSSGKDGFRWTLIPGKPTKTKWALRATNLAAEPAKLTGKDGLLEIGLDVTAALPVKGKAGMSVRFEGGGKFSYAGSEPCAVVALIHRKDGELQVLFVPDR